MSAAVPIQAFTEWLRIGERGISSESILSTLTSIPVLGQRHQHSSEPFDPADFRRCELLLREVPAARPHLHLMANVSPAWARLVERWDDLVALCEEEVPGIFDGPARGRAPRTYRLMAELRKGETA